MSDVHPFRRWREKVGYSADTAAAMIRAKGRQVSKRYLDAIETSQRRPSYETCEVMQSITEGAVTVAALRHWPLRVPEEHVAAVSRTLRRRASKVRRLRVACAHCPCDAAVCCFCGAVRTVRR